MSGSESEKVTTLPLGRSKTLKKQKSASYEDKGDSSNVHKSQSSEDLGTFGEKEPKRGFMRVRFRSLSSGEFSLSLFFFLPSMNIIN